MSIVTYKRFKLSPEQAKLVKKIQEKNAHRTIETDVFGNTRVNLNAVALQQNPEDIINRAREIRSKRNSK